MPGTVGLPALSAGARRASAVAGAGPASRAEAGAALAVAGAGPASRAAAGAALAVAAGVVAAGGVAGGGGAGRARPVVPAVIIGHRRPPPFITRKAPRRLIGLPSGF